MIIADTGFWIALANKRDVHHLAARKALEVIETGIITTWPVMTETCHLLVARLGVFSELAFLKSFSKGAFQVFDLPPDSGRRIEVLVRKYRDLPMDLADASLVILAEHLGHGRILTTDSRDFRSYRWKDRKPFENWLAKFSE